MFGDKRLSPLARSLLAGERGRTEDDVLKSQAIERARAALDRPSGVGLRSDLPLSLDSRRAPRTVWVAAAAVAAIAGLAAAAGIGAYGSANEAPPVSPPALPPVADPPPAAASPQEPAPLSEPAPSVMEPPAPPVRTAQSSGSPTRVVAPPSYAAEVALLEPARSGISHGDFAGALTALAKHRREYPSGQLVEEREALRVRALWGLGQKSSALSAAKAFRKRYPRSALLSWLGEQDDSGR